MAAIPSPATAGVSLQARPSRPLPLCGPHAGAGLRRGALPQRGSRNCSQLKLQAVVVRAETQYLQTPDEAKKLVEEGFRVLDVRDETQWSRGHIKGATHVPYFIVNTDSDLETAIKRQAHNNFSGMLYGLAFTKPNPEFQKQVQAVFPDKASKLLLVCQEGLRSNTAVDELEDLGYTSLALLERGLNKVKPGLFEKEGPRELRDAGKGGFVSIQTQFSVVLASILISILLFLQFFPDAALKIIGSA